MSVTQVGSGDKPYIWFGLQSLVVFPCGSKSQWSLEPCSFRVYELVPRYLLWCLARMICPTRWLYYKSAAEREEAGTIPGARRPGSLERGPGPNCVAQVFLFLNSIIIYRLYKLRFQAEPNHSANESQTFWFSVNICSLSAFFWGGGGIFLLEPEPALGGPWSAQDNIHTDRKFQIQKISFGIWAHDSNFSIGKNITGLRQSTQFDRGNWHPVYWDCSLLTGILLFVGEVFHKILIYWPKNNNY